jgi:hypothetical protein
LRRGRPPSNLGPTVVTTVRLPVGEWKWVKDRGAQFTALLRKQIRTEMREEEERAAVEYLRQKRTDEAGTPRNVLRAWIADRNARGLGTSQDELEAKKKELGL